MATPRKTAKKSTTSTTPRGIKADKLIKTAAEETDKLQLSANSFVEESFEDDDAASDAVALSFLDNEDQQQAAQEAFAKMCSVFSHAKSKEKFLELVDDGKKKFMDKVHKVDVGLYSRPRSMTLEEYHLHYKNYVTGMISGTEFAKVLSTRPDRILHLNSDPKSLTVSDRMALKEIENYLSYNNDNKQLEFEKVNPFSKDGKSFLFDPNAGGVYAKAVVPYRNGKGQWGNATLFYSSASQAAISRICSACDIIGYDALDAKMREGSITTPALDKAIRDFKSAKATPKSAITKANEAVDKIRSQWSVLEDDERKSIMSRLKEIIG